jgi:sugar phosphate isomerase/epimerase
MKLGVFSVLLQNMSLGAMLEKVQSLGLDSVEIGTGGYPGNHHCDLNQLIESPERIQRYGRQIESAGLFISALSCQGNPLHPNPAIAREHHAIFEKTVLLAERLGIPVINLLSGCPGDSHNARYPNWCHFAWPPEFPELWAWQWNEVAIPYWKQAAAFAEAHGIRRLAIEMHPGFLVYNPETALQLREATGNTVGVNLDPSHLFWLGIDVPSAIRKLGSAIFHVHAKDCSINRINTALNGCLDGKPYQEVGRRSWNFRTVGWGHGLEIWRDIVSALRETNYDYVLSIEHEDPLAEAEEGLRSAIDFLNQVLLRKPAGAMFWDRSIDRYPGG